MRSDVNLNGQNFHNYLLTPNTVQFTEQGNAIIKPVLEVPEEIDTIGFNYIKTVKEYEKYVHFFMQDFLFDRVWNSPTKYLEMLKPFSGVIAPDFSLFRGTPEPIQRWNHYRRQWCAAYWQANGINVIPNIRWSTENSYSWCFDGVPKNSVVCVSAIGCMKEAESRLLFFKGYEQALKVLEPKLVLLRVADSYADEIVSMTGPAQILDYNFYKGTVK